MKKNTISIERLAKLCGVSQGTVDRAIHNRPGISSRTRERILAVAKQYDYRPNTYRIQDGKSGTGLIGILVFDLYNAYFSNLVMCLERQLRQYGFCSLVMFSDKNKEQEIECVEKMYNAGVDGIILSPVNDGLVFSTFLKSWGIPAVTLGNRLEGTAHIGVDNHKAMYDLVQEALAYGWRKFAYFAPALSYRDKNLDGQSERYAGFLQAMEESGAKWELLAGIEQAEKLSEKTVIVASTDYYAEQILEVTKGKNIVTGFDDVFFGREYPTVGMDWDMVAQLAVETVTHPDGQENICVPYQLKRCERFKR